MKTTKRKTTKRAPAARETRPVGALLERAKAPTPPFFKRLRNIALALAAVGGAVLTAPVALPAVVMKTAGYLALAGTVAGAVAQVAKEDE